MAIIEVKNLCKSFRIPSVKRETIREHFFSAFARTGYEELRVLDDISFEVARGETVGIVGRNGSGKSTLLRILAQIYQPDRGTVAVHAPITPILELGAGWNGELTAEDNILLTGTAMGLSLKELKSGLHEILAFAELERFANLELKHYSRGMSSRLAYSIAFQSVREILVLDEIFAVGDAAFNAKCQARYRELTAAGRTVIIVGHDLNTINDFCDRALLLEGGHIVLNDEPRRVIEAYLEMLGAA
ncbi:MAG TPA: ABC transporter ATP-binding protein [Polyangia bacterium]|nr:ABC transporter ATP-binding protein [Polyangia bacterium]